jgi:O-antigen ligase
LKKRIIDAASEWNPDLWLFWGLVALLVCVPIPLGSDRPWAWGIMEAWAFVLLAGWIIVWAAGRTQVPATLRKAWPALALFVLWLAYTALHFAPLPAELVQALSPEAARMHTLAHATSGGAWITLSVDPHAARVAWLKSAAYCAVFLLVILLVNRRQRAEQLAYSLIFAGLALSVYGVLMHLSEVTHDYFGSVIAHGGSASATYVNRNHFAGYLEMVLAIGIGMLIATLREGRSETWKEFFRRTLELMFSPKIRLRLYLSVMVIALVTTHSRMGNTAFFSSMLIAGVIGLALSRFATRATVILLISLMVIDVTIVGSWFGVEKLAQRLEQTTVQDVEEREEPSQFAFKLIDDYPVFGAGPGSFYTVFPRYREATVVGYYDHAHNDYVQITAESGIIGIGILGAIVVLSLGAALLAQWQRHDPLMRGMAFGSVMGVTSILIHSSVDFNLQITANAMIFVVLLAMAWISLNLERRPRLPGNGKNAEADAGQA